MSFMANELSVTVNGQPIPQAAIDFEFQRLVQFYQEHGMPEGQIRAQLPSIRRRAVDQAVGAKLLIDEAARLEIKVEEEEVEKRFNELAEQVGGIESVKDLLAKQNMSVERFREELRQGRRVDKLVDQAATGVDEPTEKDIEEHYKAHQDEYSKPEQVLAQHILVKPADDSEGARESARQKLLDIKARVEAGSAVFGDEAALHSECPSGKEGGSLGWFSRGMMVPEFDNAVFSMNVETVSDIIETQFGFHIIYKTGEEKAQATDFSEVREQIRDFIRHARRGEAVEAYVAELRSKAKIEVKGT